MGYEIASEEGVVGQFASGLGYQELISAAKASEYPHLARFFEHGATQDVKDVQTDLRRLEGSSISNDVRDSVLALDELLKDQEVAVITSGNSGDGSFQKADEEPEDGWVGVDLDGTLAHYDGWKEGEIGAPIPAMLKRVRKWVAEGKDVRIFTARVADDPEGKQASAIKAWTKEHVGKELPVTCEKDPKMIELWDDRAHRVETNTGIEKGPHAGDGVMIAFWPDEAMAQRIAMPNGEPSDQLHVTLAYLGKKDEINPQALHMVEHSLEIFAAQHAPVSGVLGGLGRFPATPQSDGKDVAYLSFHSPEIQQFRSDLVKIIEAAGIESKKDFGYTPHMTMRYVSPHAPHLLPTPEPEPVTFREIVLSVGNERKRFPLQVPRPDDIEQRVPVPDDVELRGRVIKVDEAKHLVFGWFSVVEVNGDLITDTQGDKIDSDTLEQSAYDFVLYARKGGEMHDTDSSGETIGIGRLVESIVFTKEKVEAMLLSLHDQEIKAVIDLGCIAWWGGFYVDDPDTWKKVTSGELRAFSIGGRGKREKIA